MKTAIVVTFIIVCIALLIAVFFLIRKLFYHLVDKRIAEFQSDLINKQTKEIQNMYRQMQAWRHDYRNHIQNMKNRLDGDQGELERYLDDLADDLTQADTSIQTGNVMADAVLNSKLSVAEQKGVQLNIDAHIPRGIAMTDVELCSILGNLIDNAMEACEKCHTISASCVYILMNSRGSFIFLCRIPLHLSGVTEGLTLPQKQALTASGCSVSTVLQRNTADMSIASMRKGYLRPSFLFH